MSMEKKGVVDGENEAPVKRAADEKDICRRNACCGNACGTDPMSKAAEVAATQAAARNGVPVTKTIPPL